MKGVDLPKRMSSSRGSQKTMTLPLFSAVCPTSVLVRPSPQSSASTGPGFFPPRTSRSVAGYNDNDKQDKRCVWCQNFAGFKSTCFEPPNPVKKNCPMVLGWDWGKSLIDYLNTRCSYKSMKGVGPKKNELHWLADQ